ncbi:MAG: hypothetical protein ACPGTP_03305 [Bacteroidia bacterium]
MRKIIFILLSFWSANLSAQVGYRLLVDSPEVVPTNYYYLYYFDYDGALLADVDARNNAVGGLGISAEAWQEITPSIGVTSYFKYNYSGAVTESSKFPVRLDLGAFYRMGEKRKVKDVNVNVSTFKTKVDVEDNRGRYLGSVDALGVNQIMVDGTYKLQNSLRGGLTYQNGTYDRQLDGGIGTYNSLGVFAGFVRESKVHVDVALEDRKTTSAQYLRMYADVMFFPVANSDVSPLGKVSRLGFRTGAVGSFPGMRNFMNAMAPKVEVGYHVLNGSYFQVGFGYNVFKY